MEDQQLAQGRSTLDPEDWSELRSQGHRMLDDMFDYIEHIRQRPVWQPIPDDVRAAVREEMPSGPTSLASVHRLFMESILPYSGGNAHPGFMGWVQGAGTPVGMLGEMVAAGLNANLGGRDHMPIEVEREVVAWMRDLLGFPRSSGGLFVSGTSMANLIAVLVARSAACGVEVRRKGVPANGENLLAYASEECHSSVARALEISGIGSAALRLIPTNERYEIDLQLLERRIEADRLRGRKPFLVVGTAGTVCSGAVDDLSALARISQRECLWFHVDGAYGALGMFSEEIAPRLAGIERADSVALDFHKWGHVPYDAGLVLIRSGQLQRDTFYWDSSYLARDERAMSSGSPWPCDLGLELSRGFRALKTWYTLKAYGTTAIGRAISKTCDLARLMGERIVASAELELLAPVSLNIVCFRYVSSGGEVHGAMLNRVNREIAALLQESGVAAPSTSLLRGRLAIRAALVNHRTNRTDVDRFLRAVIDTGNRIAHTACRT